MPSTEFSSQKFRVYWEKKFSNLDWKFTSNNHNETMLHLFMHCLLVSLLWDTVLSHITRPQLINLAVWLSQTLIKTPHAILELAISLPRFKFTRIHKKPLRITIPHSHTLLY